MSINVGCNNLSSMGFRYFCSVKGLITSVILRDGNLEVLLICKWAIVSFMFYLEITR